jgi:hypothetical protein
LIDSISSDSAIPVLLSEKAVLYVRWKQPGDGIAISHWRIVRFEWLWWCKSEITDGRLCVGYAKIGVHVWVGTESSKETGCGVDGWDLLTAASQREEK